MNTYLISYDLRVPETSEDYQRIISYIKSLGSWSKPLQSVWFVKTSISPSDIRDGLKNQSDYNDGILVIDVTSDWASYGISKEVTEWMKSHI